MNTYVLKEFDEIYCDLSQVSIDDVYFKNIDEVDIEFNSINFKYDKPEEQSFHEYFFTRFKAHQPETYRVLAEVKQEFFYAIERSTIPEILSDFTVFGININGVIVFLKYSPYVVKQAHRNEHNFPPEIIQSWLWRSAGWYIPEDASYGSPIMASGLPSSNNPPLGSICPDIEGKSKKAREKVAFIEDKFQQPFLVDYEDDDSYDTHFQLRALIDTRFNQLKQHKNYQLFSIVNHKSKGMYIIQDQDIYSIQKLNQPAEAIDRYAAHLLSRQAGEFDFLEYAEDFSL